MTIETPQAKKTLQELLQAMTDADNDQLSFDPEVLRGDLGMKVDDYRNVIDHYEATAAMFAAQAVPLVKAAKTAENTAERIKELMLFNMQQQKFEELPGINWKAQVQKTKTWSIVNAELLAPNAQTRMKWPDFVDVKYATKTAEVIKAAKADPVKFKDVVKEGERDSLHFYTNTKARKKPSKETKE